MSIDKHLQYVLHYSKLQQARNQPVLRLELFNIWFLLYFAKSLRFKPCVVKTVKYVLRFAI